LALLGYMYDCDFVSHCIDCLDLQLLSFHILTTKHS